METAVRLAPNNIAVLIPRGAILVTVSRFTPATLARPILETAVGDFEKVLKLQESTLADEVHAREPHRIEYRNLTR